MAKEKGKKKIALPTASYLDEREVDMEVMSKQNLRQFSKILYKSLLETFKDLQFLNIEKKKLTTYWDTVNKRYEELDEEEKNRDFVLMKADLLKKLRKLGLRSEKLLLDIKNYSTKMILIKSLAVDKVLANREIFNNIMDMYLNSYRAYRDLFKMKYKHFATLMEFDLNEMKNFQFLDIKDIQRERICYRRDTLRMLIQKSQEYTKKELQMVSEKENEVLKNYQINYGFILRLLYDEIFQKNEHNTNLLEQRLFKTRDRYRVLNDKKEELKAIVDKLENPIAVVKNERDILLNIIDKRELEEDIHNNILKQHEDIDKILWKLRIRNYISDSKLSIIKQIKFDINKKLFKLIDNAIMQHMTKKVLPYIKVKAVKEKIKYYNYLLTEILQNDPQFEPSQLKLINNCCNQMLDSLKVNCKQIKYSSRLFTSTDNPEIRASIGTIKHIKCKDLFKKEKYELDNNDDPFGLMAVPDMEIDGIIKQQSLYRGYKNVMEESRIPKKIDVRNMSPVELLKFIHNYIKKFNYLKTRLNYCLKRNLYHIDNIPVNLKKLPIIKLFNFIKKLEDFTLVTMYRQSGIPLSPSDYSEHGGEYIEDTLPQEETVTNLNIVTNDGGNDNDISTASEEFNTDKTVVDENRPSQRQSNVNALQMEYESDTSSDTTIPKSSPTYDENTAVYTFGSSVSDSNLQSADDEMED